MMTRQEMIEYCKKRIEELSNSLQEENKELELYDSVLEDSNNIFTKDECNVGQGDLFLAYFNAIAKDTNIEDNVQSLYPILEAMDTIDEDRVDKLDKMLNAISKVDDIEEAIKTLNTKGISIKKIALKPLKGVINELPIEIPKEAYQDFANIIKLYRSHNFEIRDTMEFMYALKIVLQYKNQFKEFTEEVYDNTGEVIKEKEKDKLYSKGLKDQESVKKVKECLGIIKKYHSELYSKEKQKERQARKDKTAYSNFISNIQTEFKKDEITNYESIIKKIPDKDLKIEFLKMVYNHNNIEYDKQNSIYEELNKNADIHYLSLLKDNNISKEEINLNKIMTNSYEEVSSMIDLLKSMELSKTSIINALEKSNLSIIKDLKDIRDNGIITNDTIENNKELLDKNSNDLNELKDNIKIFTKTGLNAAKVLNNPEVLIHNKNLKENIDVLNTYNLLDSMKNTNNFHFLIEDNLVEKIDTYLELGYENCLSDNLSMLNEEHLKRLYVLKNMNIPLSNKKEIREVLRNKNFIISDDELDEYIPDVSEYFKDEDLKIDLADINEYSTGNNTYNVNGVILSKNRINRNLEETDNLFKAIITNRITSLEEIKKLEKSLNKNKVKVKSIDI